MTRQLGAARSEWIAATLAAHPECHCPIDPDMTDDELMTVKSCRPGWQCSVLDFIRRDVVNYQRHRKGDPDVDG